MLRKKSKTNTRQMQMVCIEDLVPQDHILRIISQNIDFNFIYDLVEDLYSANTGRPSIDPVSLIKIVLLQHLFGIRSMRQTIQDLEVNVAYRWFIGYDLLEPVPHFSTFGKNYKRRFEGSELFECIFARILEEALNCGFVTADMGVFIDATHIKANANKHKVVKEVVAQQAVHYYAELMEEINADREAHGKKPFDDENVNNSSSSMPTKTVTKSTTDPDAGMFHKSEKERCFAYTAHVACDHNNFVVAVDLSPGNVNDSVMFDSVFKKVTDKFRQIDSIAVDAGYKTPWIARQIIDAGILPAMPYKRPQTKPGFFRKYEYVYDEYYDCIICPNNQVVKYSTTNRQGYREYKSDPNDCKICPLLTQCTHSRNHTKVVTRHVWQDYMEQVEDIRHSPEGKYMYGLRAQTIERVFADAKEKHGMRYTQLRGLAKVKAQALLVFTCMNLKKLAKWKQKKGALPFIFCWFKIKVVFTRFIIQKQVLTFNS